MKGSDFGRRGSGLGIGGSGLGIRGLGFGRDPAQGRRAICLGLAVLGVTLLQGCAPKSAPAPPSFFPATNEVPGWSKTGDTRTFEASRLWEYIDGDAEKYIQAGVERTLTTDYRYRDKVEATADVYVMKAGEGARKIFDSESSMGSRPVQIGDAGRLSRASLTFRKGPYFVRLVAYEEAPEVGDALVALGRAIEKKLGVRD